MASIKISNCIPHTSYSDCTCVQVLSFSERCEGRFRPRALWCRCNWHYIYPLSHSRIPEWRNSFTRLCNNSPYIILYLHRAPRISAQQAKLNNYKNTKLKLLKTNAAIWFNKLCKIKQLKPNYINIKNSPYNSLNFLRANLYIFWQCVSGNDSLFFLPTWCTNSLF